MGKLTEDILEICKKLKEQSEFTTKFTGEDPETESFEWDVEYKPDFESLYDDINKVVKRLEKVSKSLKNSKATLVLKIARSLRNQYSRLVKQYSDLEESMTSQGGGSATAGSGMGYTSAKAFTKKDKLTKNKNIYKHSSGYTKVPKQIKGSGLEVKKLFEGEFNEFQKERIDIFDRIETELNEMSPLISNAKNKTIEYYSNNPGSFAIINSTDLILDYIKDIKTLLKGKE